MTEVPTGENQDPEDQNQFVSEEEMSEEDRKALQENEDFILNFKDEDLEDEEKKDKLEKLLADRKILATTIAQKRHYREKVKPGKTPAAAAPAAPAATQEKPVDDTSTMLTFRLDHPELSKDVAKEVIDFARAHKISPDEALKKPVIKSYIASAKKDEDVEDATPGPSRGGRGSGPAAKDWSKASQAEVEAERARIQAQGS